MMKIGFLVIVFAALIAVPLVRADQNSAKLPPLFDRLSKAGNPIEAENIARQIWRIWIHHKDPEVQRFMALGIAAMNQNNYEDAFNAFEHVVGIAPDFAEGWNKRATVNYILKRLSASMRDIERTLALEPRHFGALSGLAIIFDTIGNNKAAADAWDRALNVHPNIRGARKHLKELRGRLKGKLI